MKVMLWCVCVFLPQCLNLWSSSGQYSGQPVDVPQNHKRAVCDLTVADRLSLYNHVIGVLNQQKEAASSSNEDLYVDLVSKLQKGRVCLGSLLVICVFMKDLSDPNSLIV